MHKHTGLTCQSQISRQQQSILLSIPGQAWYPGTSLAPRLDSKRFLTLSPSHLGCQLKPLTADWDLNPCARTQTQPKPSFGLKPTWLGIEPSKNPAWDLNPRGWDSVSFSHSVMSDSDSMDCSTSGFPVHHQLPEITQTHVHRVGDAIQPSHPLLSPSLPAFNLPQHQGFFK